MIEKIFSPEADLLKEQFPCFKELLSSEFRKNIAHQSLRRIGRGIGFFLSHLSRLSHLSHLFLKASKKNNGEETPSIRRILERIQLRL